MGEWNWWAPKPLRWLHKRLGFDDGHALTQSAHTEPLRADRAFRASVIDTG
jgi:hypothetical protein